MISLHLAVSSPKKYKARGVFGSLASLLLALSAFAQGDSSLWGKVTDQTDAPVSGATIVIKNLETDTERRLMTDDAGLFNAAALPVGQYVITAAKTGFQTDRRGAIRLTVAEREEVDLKLQVGDVHQTIEVPAFSTAVQISTEDSSGLVGEREVKDLPLNGRSFADFHGRHHALPGESGRRRWRKL